MKFENEPHVNGNPQGRRAQAEVDALWPASNYYRIRGVVTAGPAVVHALGRLYEPGGGVAGRFEVTRVLGNRGDRWSYEVAFVRYVAEDSEAANDDLLGGGDLSAVLVGQLRKEIASAIGRAGVDLSVEITGTPEFCHRKGSEAVRPLIDNEIVNPRRFVLSEYEDDDEERYDTDLMTTDDEAEAGRMLEELTAKGKLVRVYDFAKGEYLYP